MTKELEPKARHNVREFTGRHALLLALVAVTGMVVATWLFQSKKGKEYASGASVAATIVYTGLTYKLIAEGRQAEVRRRDHDDTVDEQHRIQREIEAYEKKLSTLHAVRCELLDNLRIVGPGFGSMDAAPDATWRYLDEAIPLGSTLPKELHNSLHTVRYNLVMYQTSLEWWRVRSAQQSTEMATFDGIIGPSRTQVTQSATEARKLLISHLDDLQSKLSTLNR